MHRPPAQRKSASESEWFVHVTLRVHELTLLTRREKEVLQRRPALLQLVRDYCLEVTALESFELDGNRRPFEQKERYRAEAIANEPHRLAGLQRDWERLARLRALRAEREAALLSQALCNILYHSLPFACICAGTHLPIRAVTAFVSSVRRSLPEPFFLSFSLSTARPSSLVTHTVAGHSSASVALRRCGARRSRKGRSKDGRTWPLTRS